MLGLLLLPELDDSSVLLDEPACGVAGSDGDEADEPSLVMPLAAAGSCWTDDGAFWSVFLIPTFESELALGLSVADWSAL